MSLTGYLTVDPELDLRAANPQAPYLLSEFFDSDGKTCPAELSDLVEPIRRTSQQAYWLPAARRTFRSSSGRMLYVTTVYNFSLRTANFVLELRDVAAAKLPVTSRETEVLEWIARGKTDGEIASLLHISVRTVQKHIEHIFSKLGVETRTAALARFIEASSSPIDRDE